MTTELKVAANGKSHTGKVREENQDSIRLYESADALTTAHYGHVYAIADGMGGYSHGGLASSIALETFFATFYAGQPGKAISNLRSAVNQANIAVLQTSNRMGAVRMGTTLSAVNLVGSQLFVAHVGDSRVYLVREGKATCLTQDHTMVGDLVRKRVLSPDKVRTHERRSVLNKCIGIELFIQPDISQYAVCEGDLLILCSDGVWSVIQDDEFAEAAQGIPEPEPLAQALIDLAMERDSDDNVSAVVVQIQSLPEAETAAEEGRGWSLGQFLRGWLSGKA